MKVQLSCTQLEDTHILVLYQDVLSVGARFCWFSVWHFGRFISDTELIVGSDGYISYLYGMPFLWIEPRLLCFTSSSPVTVLIMIIQLPLLASSWFVFPGSYNGKCVAWNFVRINIIIIPGLILLTSNLKLQTCLQVYGRPIDCDHWFLPIYSFYLSLDAFAS